MTQPAVHRDSLCSQYIMKPGSTKPSIRMRPIDNTQAGESQLRQTGADSSALPLAAAHTQDTEPAPRKRTSPSLQPREQVVVSSTWMYWHSEGKRRVREKMGQSVIYLKGERN